MKQPRTSRRKDNKKIGEKPVLLSEWLQIVKKWETIYAQKRAYGQARQN